MHVCFEEVVVDAESFHLQGRRDAGPASSDDENCSAFHSVCVGHLTLPRDTSLSDQLAESRESMEKLGTEARLEKSGRAQAA